jgi:hypothetical protein
MLLFNYTIMFYPDSEIIYLKLKIKKGCNVYFRRNQKTNFISTKRMKQFYAITLILATIGSFGQQNSKIGKTSTTLVIL